MSFAGFGAALGDLFTGISAANQEQEKSRRAQQLLQSQLQDLAAQATEREAIAAQRKAQAEKISMMSSPEFTTRYAKALSEGNPEDIAWVIQRAPELANNLTRPTPTPKVHRPAEFVLQGKPVQGSYDESTGKYFYQGQDVTNRGIMPIAKPVPGALTPSEQLNVLHRNLQDVLGQLPQPGKEKIQKTIPDLETKPSPQNPWPQKPNPPYLKALSDSASWYNQHVVPAMQAYQNAAKQLGIPVPLTAMPPSGTPAPASTPAPAPGTRVPFATRLQQLKAQNMTREQALAQLQGEGYDTKTGR